MFWLIGAYTYAQDVALIESEMVETAKWVAANVPQDDVIAAHDIGALGYYDSHALIDLAGLVSPEVLPFIRDEEKLAEFLDEQGASYLIAFPDFYPLLSKQAEPVFITDGIGPDLGGKNMTVFHWR
jgi:ABC-type Zn2+ transport system substrate-binding protein/surface adhesin